MRVSCYWKWIRGDLHSERRSREPKLESGAARRRTKGSVGKVRNKEMEGERGEERRGVAGLVCVRAQGRTDDERRERRKPQMKG